MRGQITKTTAALVAAVCLSASLAGAEIVQEGALRISLEGTIAPHGLPRQSRAPVEVTLAAGIQATNGQNPPQLRRISLAINRNGRLDYRGLPRCNFHQIQPASTEEARASCKRSLVGEGSFKANVALPEQSPFPSDGKILAFNGNLHGRPVIYAHIYGTEPLPTSFVLPFEIERGGGRYGTTLNATLPPVAADWGFVRGVSLTLRRTFTYRGKRHSYISAGCPAPKGFPGATFPFARVSMSFLGGRKLSSTLVRSCRARG